MEHSTDRVTVINGLIDFILANVRLNADKLKDYEVVPIPDLKKRLRFNLLVATLTTSLVASQGTLSDLRTIRRVGDVIVTSKGNTLFVSVALTLDFLELVFHHYTLKVGMIKKSGDKLQLNVRKTYFDAFLTITFEGLDCEIVFGKFEMIDFTDVDVNLTGFGFLNPIAGRIAEWIVEYFNHFIVKEIAEEYARGFLNMALKNKRTLQKLFSHGITGMVLNATRKRAEKNNSAAVENVQISRNVDVHPVAPLRQRRRNTSNCNADERRNNLNSSNTSLTGQQNYTAHRPNNEQPQDSEPRLQVNSSSGSRLPVGTLKNNLTSGRNEIIVQSKKLFSKKCSDRVDINYIPIKPPML